jgi:hypothetical protein
VQGEYTAHLHGSLEHGDTGGRSTTAQFNEFNQPVSSPRTQVTLGGELAGGQSSGGGGGGGGARRSGVMEFVVTASAPGKVPGCLHSAVGLRTAAPRSGSFYCYNLAQPTAGGASMGHTRSARTRPQEPATRRF